MTTLAVVSRAAPLCTARAQSAGALRAVAGPAFVLPRQAPAVPGLAGAKRRHAARRVVIVEAKDKDKKGSSLPGDKAPAVVAAAPAAAMDTKLAVYFVLWYAFNIVFNLLNKSALNVFPFPWLLATIQLACGVIFMVGLWVTKLQPMPVVPAGFWGALAPVALFHTIGHVAACVSFAQVAVSFTHVIKSAEPVFSVVILSMMGETYSLPVWLSLLPIVLGCSLAAMKEVTFNMGGFTGAMISNLGFVLRNIYSKQSLDNYKNIDAINLYALISIAGLLYLAPVAYIVEGGRWAAGWTAAMTQTTATELVKMIAAGGLFYHLYNQVSYMALEGINPVTFSVGNTMKRVVVIASSILFFKNPVSPLNLLGSAIAILGTYLYTEAKRLKPAPKAATA